MRHRVPPARGGGSWGIYAPTSSSVQGCSRVWQLLPSPGPQPQWYGPGKPGRQRNAGSWKSARGSLKSCGLSNMGGHGQYLLWALGRIVWTTQSKGQGSMQRFQTHGPFSEYVLSRPTPPLPGPEVLMKRTCLLVPCDLLMETRRPGSFIDLIHLHVSAKAFCTNAHHT